MGIHNNELAIRECASRPLGRDGFFSLIALLAMWEPPARQAKFQLRAITVDLDAA